jgi:hypothetical protein
LLLPQVVLPVQERPNAAVHLADAPQVRKLEVSAGVDEQFVGQSIEDGCIDGNAERGGIAVG